MTMNIFTGNLTQGFCYVPQDNYILCKPQTESLGYLYADSATSCIIVIVTGKDRDGEPLVAVSHLSCEIRFKAFFDIVEKNFTVGASVYAAGANPPEERECIKNARTFMKWAAGFNAEHYTVALGSGIPNHGCGAYGINVNPASADYLKVSNKYFHLPNETIRDPEDGGNILFCKLGLRTGLPSLVLRDMNVPLTDEEKNALVAEAEKQGWLDVFNMTDKEVLDRYSTTPKFEPSWFVGNIRRAGEFVEMWKKNKLY
jgi:hypothetical protein